jgi:hypothetical protein
MESPLAEVQVWWIPRLGVCDQREPSLPALGSSVTS